MDRLSALLICTAGLRRWYEMKSEHEHVGALLKILEAAVEKHAIPATVLAPLKKPIQEQKLEENGKIVLPYCTCMLLIILLLN